MSQEVIHTKVEAAGTVDNRRIFRNIAASFLFKALNFISQLFLIRITLTFINSTEYGVWMTISSLLLWLTLFDFGFTNGLRNKLTQICADGRYREARIQISTAYFFLFIVCLSLSLLFWLVAVWVDWRAVLNAPAELSEVLPGLVIISFGLFCLRVALNLIGGILYAVHQSAQVELINTFIQFSTLVVLYVWSLVSAVDLMTVAVIYSLMPVVVLVLATALVFSGRYRQLRPSVSLIRPDLLRELGTMGGKFFALQLISLILFASQNIIIAQLFSPEEVTPFNLVYRYFSVIPLGFSVVIVPYWAAITEAFHRQDIDWVKRTLRRLMGFWALFSVLSMTMVVLAEWVYLIWLGKGHVPIAHSLTVVLGISTALQAWGSLFSLVLNALGKISVQLILAPVILIISIPLALYLAHQPGLGVTGVPLAFTICLLPGALVQPYQCYLLLSRKAKGIWNR